MKISYAITVCNELEEVKRLLDLLLEYKREQDEIVVLYDNNGTKETFEYLKSVEGIKFAWDNFQHNFAEWKNKLTELCSGDYVFQIDADEYPHTYFIESLPAIIETNPDVDVYLVPRVNTVDGLTQEHIQKWGWRVDGNGWVNWPDWQHRIYRNSDNVKWENKVHEILTGHKQFTYLPMSEEYALFHPKAISRQEKQNDYYESLQHKTSTQQQKTRSFENKLTVYDTCWGKYAVHYYAQDLVKSLSDQVDVELKTVDLKEYQGLVELNNLEGSSIVVEAEDGRFIVFDWGDTYEVNQGVIKLSKHPNCVGYFNSQPSDVKNDLKTYIPHLEFKYGVFGSRYKNHYSSNFDQLDDCIYFNGQITDLRIANNKFLKEGTYKQHPEFKILQKTDFDTYLRDVFNSKIIYSPAGGGDFAHRDFEMFALGIPVIRQKYRSTTTTLQEGVHYIDVDSIKDFGELLKNKELLCSIGANGRLWYEQNCQYPGNVSDMVQLIKDTLL